MRWFAAPLIALVTGFALAAPQPDDDWADAKADIQRALAQADQAQVPVLVGLGLALTTGSSGPLVERHFEVGKVNVGRFDRNTDIAASDGVPLKKDLPAVAVPGPNGQSTHATRAGELADARALGERGIHDVFAKAAAGGQ